MNQRASVMLLLTLATSFLPLAASASEVVEVLPGGTQVPVHVVGTVSSGSAHVHDIFTVTADDDITVHDRVVIKRGAQGQAEVTSVEHAGGSGHSGSLGIKFHWIYAADGGKVRLSDSNQSSAEEDRKGASSTATIIGVATFGIGGLFGHNFARGKEVTLDETKKLTAFVASNVHVMTSEEGEHHSDRFDR